MKSIFYFVVSIYIILSTSCAPRHSPLFFVNESETKAKKALLRNITIKLDPSIDERTFKYKFLQDAIKPKGISKDGNYYCLNIEIRYHKNYWKELDVNASKYLDLFMGVGEVTTANTDFDYKVSWTISKFYIKQLFSKEAAQDQADKDAAIITGSIVGGVIGAVVADALTNGLGEGLFETNGEVQIELRDIKIHDNKGLLIKQIDSHELHLLNESMVADAECECAYYNLDLYYRQLLMDLAPKIESAIADNVISSRDN